MAQHYDFLSSDIFFKFALVSDDEDSRFLLRTIIESVLEIKVNSFKVLNPDIIPSIKKGKDVILDVLIQTDRGYRIDVEMRMSPYNSNQSRRFQYYGSKMVTSQLKRGHDYEALLPVYQIIFINDLNNDALKLSSHFMFRDEDHISEENALNHRYFFYMPYINMILKEKKFADLSDLEKIISIFKNGLSDDIIGTGKVVEAMKNKCEEFTESDLKDYYEDAFERARLSHLGDIKVAKREGKAEGLNEGKRTALIEAIKAFITSRYPKNDLSFLEILDEDQLKELLLKSPTITLEELESYQQKRSAGL